MLVVIIILTLALLTEHNTSQDSAKHLPCIILLILHNSLIVITPILQMRKLRLRETSNLAKVTRSVGGDNRTQDCWIPRPCSQPLRRIAFSFSMMLCDLQQVTQAL